MEKGKQLLSYLSGIFSIFTLALIVLFPGIKADAALTVKSINYEDSTITIQSSTDQTLYFSDKKKKKWETAADGFANGECTIDISWISTTKDYEITFKGDKTADDILSVIIPKQVTNFKAKYNQATGEVTFTNLGVGREIEYRKNNTDKWKPFDTPQSDGLKESLRRLSENGASVYFRLKSKAGTSAADTGLRPSKETACKISKKTAAPTASIETKNSTISVQAGWQVREVTMDEKSGVQYLQSIIPISGNVTGLDATVEKGEWRTFQMTRDVPISEIASAAMYQDVSNMTEEAAKGAYHDVYLQFRKSATSSTQVSYNTTIKVPKQAAPPVFNQGDISIEYTSATSFKMSIPVASPSNVFEYCLLDSSEFNENRIIDLDGTDWKTISTATGTEIKKTDAPDNSFIFIRKKAIGKTGDDNFELATHYVKYASPIQYPSTVGGTMSLVPVEIIDGAFENNSSGSSNITFSVYSQYNVGISQVGFSRTANPTGVGENTATVTSTVKKDTTRNDEYKYLITATITDIKLSAGVQDDLKNDKKVKLYAYILLNTNGGSKEEIKSNDQEGLVLTISPKSEIDTSVNTSDKKNAVNVTRIIGSSTNGITSNEQYESFWFKMSTTSTIKSVQLGNYTLGSSDYSYNSSTERFTVNLQNFETRDEVFSCYGKQQNLVITLSNGEILNTVKIKLVPPVSLSSTYAWVFAAGSLPDTEQKSTTTTSSGSTTTTTTIVNNYSVNYTVAGDTVNSVRIDSVQLKSATLNDNGVDTNIMYDSAADTKKITFSNTLLKKLHPMVNTPVILKFSVTYSNNRTVEYTIKKGCSFTIV